MSNATKQPNQKQQHPTPPQAVKATIPNGLIATGLVVIVGSWFGMAVYMNHRLNDLEKDIRSENAKVVSSVVDKSTLLSDKMDTVQLRMSVKVDETSSVLAKGILELTETDTKHHTELVRAIEESQKQVTTALTRNQEEQTKTITEALTSASEARQSNNEQLLTVIKDTKQSLEQLVNNGAQDHSQKLTTLANIIDQLPQDSAEKSKIINAQLTALSNRIQEVQQQLAASQQSVEQINKTLPGWKKESADTLSDLNARIARYEEGFGEQMNKMQEQILALHQDINRSSENLLKTLYLTTEGLEGTKYELKSEVETMKQAAKSDFDKLAESIESISTALSEMKKDFSLNSFDTTRLELNEMNDVIDTAHLFSQNAHEMNLRLQGHVEEVKAWMKKQNSGSPMNREWIEKMISEYQSYIDLNTQKIASLDQSVSEIQSAISSNQQPETSDPEESESNDKTESDKNETTTALHPEERTESEVGVTLY